jgi:hypothetical protein
VTERSKLTARHLAASLPGELHRARRVRVFDEQGPVEPARKRRGRAPSALLADLTDTDALSTLATALQVRPDTDVMHWMSWPDLWLAFSDDQGDLLLILGLIRPDWVRWDPHGDLRLAAPESLGDWLTDWA